MAFTEQKNEMIRKDLLDEALRCAVTVGIRKTSVEQLTEAVGIAKGSFYTVFPSKDLLFFAVLENTHAETYAVAESLTRQCRTSTNGASNEDHSCRLQIPFRYQSYGLHRKRCGVFVAADTV